MKKKSFLINFFLFLSLCTAHISAQEATEDLKNVYEYHHRNPSDINEHLPRLRELASECSSVVEIGVRSIVSTWSMLYGLVESNEPTKVYLAIDLEDPPYEKLLMAKAIAAKNRVSFHFLRANDMKIDPIPTDLLFIDSLHTYCHLTYELEHFSPLVNKYIALHDTSAPWGDRDDSVYFGDYSEYPASINREKRGLWPAVEDFLATHPEWQLKARHLNNHGLTVLERVGN